MPCMPAVGEAVTKSLGTFFFLGQPIAWCHLPPKATFKAPCPTKRFHGGLDLSPSDARARNRELIDAFAAASSRCSSPILVFLCPPTPAILENGPISRLFVELETDFTEALASSRGMRVLSSRYLIELMGVGHYHNSGTDRVGHIPYTPAAYAALDTAVFRAFHALQRPPYKVVVVDCGGRNRAVFDSGSSRRPRAQSTSSSARPTTSRCAGQGAPESYRRYGPAELVAASRKSRANFFENNKPFPNSGTYVPKTRVWTLKTGLPRRAAATGCERRSP